MLCLVILKRRSGLGIRYYQNIMVIQRWTRLLRRTVCSGSKIDSKEKTLWEAAERNVFEMEEDDDNEDQGEVDEEEYCYEE